MGSLALRGMLQGDVSLDVALGWHLQYNHFPPIPADMVGPCKRAIANANRGDWDRMVRLPVGVTYRGRRTAPTEAVIRQHHLDGFIDEKED